jgi:hypothetical protein
MSYEGSALYELGTRLSDRLGSYLDSDSHWFSQLVEFWRTSDGARLYAFELSDLGRKTVQLLTEGRSDEVEPVFNELEAAITGADSDVQGLCLEVIEGLDAELVDLREEDPLAFERNQSSLQVLLGPVTRQAWVGMRSSP